MSRIQAAFKENDSTLDTAPCAEKILTHFVRILTESAENLLSEHGGVVTRHGPVSGGCFMEFCLY